MIAMILLLGLILIIIGVLIYQKMSIQQQKTEGFTSQTETQLTFCPVNTNAYLNAKGDTECCDGEVKMNECLGKAICAIATNSSLPSCSEVQQTYNDLMAKDICPAGLKYYESKTASGCANILNPTRDGPGINSETQCIHYSDMNSSYAHADSCHNQKKLQNSSENMPDLFKNSGTSYISSALSPVKIGKETIQIVNVTYGLATGAQNTCQSADDIKQIINLQQQNNIINQDQAMARINLVTEGLYRNDCAAASAYYSTKALTTPLQEFEA